VRLNCHSSPARRALDEQWLLGELEDADYVAASRELDAQEAEPEAAENPWKRLIKWLRSR
jgi:hypothetical protein